MGVLQDLGDVVFGTKPKVIEKEKSLLTPEQKAAYDKLLAEGPTDPGDVQVAPVGGAQIAPVNSINRPQANAPQAASPNQATAQTVDPSQIDTSKLSLEKLAEFQSNLANSQASQIYQQVAGDALDPNSELVQKGLIDPLRAERDASVQDLNRGSTSNFFSSDRVASRGGIEEAFATAEAQALLGLVGQGQDRALQAAGGLTNISGLGLEATKAESEQRLSAELANLQSSTTIDTANLSAMTQTSLANLDADVKTTLSNLDAATDVELANLNAELEARVQNMNAELQVALQNADMAQATEIQNALMELEAARMNTTNRLQSQALYQDLVTTPTKENIIINQEGSGGLLGGLASGVGTGLGMAAGAALSDRRLKNNILRIGDLPAGIGLYIWRWKHSGVPSVGVIAQEVQKVFPDTVINIGGLLMVKYKKLIQLLSELRTQEGN